MAASTTPQPSRAGAPFWLRAVAILCGLPLLYLAFCFLWHDHIRHRIQRSDPFAAIPQESFMGVMDSCLVDVRYAYDKWLLRPRSDPDGNEYFPPGSPFRESLTAWLRCCDEPSLLAQSCLPEAPLLTLRYLAPRSRWCLRVEILIKGETGTLHATIKDLPFISYGHGICLESLDSQIALDPKETETLRAFLLNEAIWKEQSPGELLASNPDCSQVEVWYLERAKPGSHQILKWAGSARSSDFKLEFLKKDSPDHFPANWKPRDSAACDTMATWFRDKIAALSAPRTSP